ncbi:iron ABC transporter permease [Paracoccus liaowanqingii]|uniref:Iron ABC transporter permease n=2 Tax=Paracoccus liaowanqingii TaxID=2560053 RepID=A0A4Z1CBC2_9RHOB|nr:iron ABC transporter permease [Paracoccus liaowanqingii]
MPRFCRMARTSRWSSPTSMAADLHLLGDRRTGGGERMLALALCVYVGLITVWPLGQLLLTAFGPGDEGQVLGTMRDTLSARATGRAFWNTLTLSLVSVGVSVVLGAGLALAVGLMLMPFRAVLSFLILMPLIIPSQILALSWIELLGSQSPILGPLGLAPAPGQGNPLYSRMGIALVMGIEHMPLVFIAIRAALKSVPADLVEAARIASVPPARVLARVILPLVAPSALAGALLAFTAAVGNFGIPALLGIPGRVPMLTTLIYQRLNGFGPSVAGQVAVLALILTLIAVAALALRAVLMRQLRMQIEGGRAFAPSRSASLWAQALIWAGVAVIAILPLAALVLTSLVPAIGVPFSREVASLDQYARVLANAAVTRAFGNSLMLSGAAAILCVAVTLPLAYLATRRPSPAVTALELLAEAPWVVPGTVVALAMILAFLPPLPLVGVSLYGTAAILLIAYLARFLPLVLRPVMAAAQGADPGLDEAARIAGLGLADRMGRIFAPSVLAAALAGGMLVVMTAMNELTLSALLWSSGHETIGVMVFSLQYEGNSTAAAAVSVLSTLLLLALCALAQVSLRGAGARALPWHQG